MAETFGKTDKGDTEYSWANRILATKFQSGSAGSLQSISAYIKYSAGNKVKCAIYDVNFNLLENGTTEEKTIIAEQDGFLEFNFGATKPTVTASTDYHLCFYFKAADNFYYSPGGDHQMGYYYQVYNSWPASFTPNEWMDWECSIYATYEEAPPVKKTLVQAALISIPPLIVLPTLNQILKLTGGC